MNPCTIAVHLLKLDAGYDMAEGQSDIIGIALRVVIATPSSATKPFFPKYPWFNVLKVFNIFGHGFKHLFHAGSKVQSLFSSFV